MKDFESKLPKIKEMIDEKLGALRVPKQLKGYDYLASAILLLVEDSDYILNKEKLYSEVAQKHNNTTSSVEKCIARAVSETLVSGNKAELEKYFGYTIANGSTPSTLEFMAMISDVVRLVLRYKLI